MCVYSMIADHYIGKWKDYLPPAQPQPYYMPPGPVSIPTFVTYPMNPLTQEEIDEVRKLLAKAKKYDEETGQKDCELQDKKDLLKKLAKELGVELEL